MVVNPYPGPQLDASSYPVGTKVYCVLYYGSSGAFDPPHVGFDVPGIVVAGSASNSHVIVAFLDGTKRIMNTMHIALEKGTHHDQKSEH